MELQTVMVYCTVPDAKTGVTIAETLLKERLCACVNRIPGVCSYYIYEGEYCEEQEELLLIKTTAAAFERLKTRIGQLHPYDVPEIIAADITQGNDDYLAWLRNAIA